MRYHAIPATKNQLLGDRCRNRLQLASAITPGPSRSGDGDLLYLVDTVGGSGGASTCIVSTTDPTGTTLGTCTTGSTTTGSSNGNITLVNNGWPKPSWQTGVAGIPSDGVRDIPDVSFFASDGFLSSSAYLVCVSAASQDPECTYATSSEPFAEEVGGTSWRHRRWPA